MKTRRITALLILSFIMLSTVSYSQNGRGPHQKNNIDGKCKLEERIPDLTDAQKDKIEALRLKHLKETKTLKNELGEKKARLKTLSDKDNPDVKAIEKTIDEKQKIQKKLYLNGIKHKQEVRDLLTEKQKTYFDAMPRRSHSRKAHNGYRSNCNMRGPKIENSK